MRQKVGFVIVSHNNPEQVLFLCQRLTARFDGAPIAIHHDFGQCPLERSGFPDNVAFVDDYSATRWAGWGIVEGAIKALRLLYAMSDPDWFVVLSGADYPIKSSQRILHDLESHHFDAYLDYRRIERCDLPLPTNGWGAENTTAPAWVGLAFERYMAIRFGFYRIATKLGWKRTAIYLRSRFFIRRLTPFREPLECFAGDFWLTANQKVAKALLADTVRTRQLSKHFSRRLVPDEGFFHTVLGNTAGLNICSDNKRFTDWVGMVDHPRILSEVDYPTLVSCSDHFARKMLFDPQSLLRLDELVDQSERSSKP